MYYSSLKYKDVNNALLCYCRVFVTYKAVQLTQSSNELWITAALWLISSCWQYIFKSISWCNFLHSLTSSALRSTIITSLIHKLWPCTWTVIMSVTLNRVFPGAQHPVCWPFVILAIYCPQFGHCCWWVLSPSTWEVPPSRITDPALTTYLSIVSTLFAITFLGFKHKVVFLIVPPFDGPGHIEMLEMRAEVQVLPG